MDFKSYRSEIKSRNSSVKELITDFLDKIDKIDPKINAFTTKTRDKAISQAEIIDQEISNNSKLPLLFGLPVSI